MEKRIRITYDVVTPESAEHGDFAESGWDCEEGIPVEAYDGETHVEHAVRLLRYEGCSHHGASSSDFYGRGIWYDDRGSTNYRTGAVRTRSFHLYGFTEAEEYQIWLALGGKPMRPVPRCSTCGGVTHVGLPCNPSEATNALLDVLDGTADYYARQRAKRGNDE